MVRLASSSPRREGRPLSWMTRLSGSVSYFVPPAETQQQQQQQPNANRKDPELILLFSWMGAKDEHIAKYVEQHRVVFPTSRIVVARCPFAHVVCPPLAWFQIKPVVPIIQPFIDPPDSPSSSSETSSLLDIDLEKHQHQNQNQNQLSPSSQKPPARVLIHAFSNGGISTAMLLYTALKRAQGGDTLLLPRYTLLFDSCPGTFRWRNTAAAMAQVAPWWTHLFIRACVFSVWLFYRAVPVLQPTQDRNTRQIRHPRYLAREVRRGYLYGSEDDKIPEGDIEKEAALAVEAGFDVHTERFEGAKHCAIPVTHAARYWCVVREIWDGEQAAEVVVDEDANVELVDVQA